MEKLKELAMNGGTPAAAGLPPRGHMGKEEKAAVDALFDEMIASGNAPTYHGKQEEAFCKEFAEYLGGGYADGVNSGTNSVFVALRALDLPPFSEVLFGCITDNGGVMPIVMNNCIPVPVDTMPGSFNIGPEQIEARITERTSAIVIAHIMGEPADMPAIMKVAEKHHLPVVEDCAQSHAAKINGQNVGTFGTVAAFSMMSGKHMCAGGQGAAVFTKDEKMYWKVRRCADRGKPFGVQASSSVEVSLNFNMDEIHAAIARAQLKKLPYFSAGRQKAVEWLKTHGLYDLKCLTFQQTQLKPGFECCYWRLVCQFHPEKATCTKDVFVKALAAEGLPVAGDYHAGYPPCHQWFVNRAEQFPWNAPQYKGDRFAAYPCPNAEAALDANFLLMMQENFSDDDCAKIMRAFQKVDAAFAK